jgi:hypothetical protein
MKEIIINYLWQIFDDPRDSSWVFDINAESLKHYTLNNNDYPILFVQKGYEDIWTQDNKWMVIGDYAYRLSYFVREKYCLMFGEENIDFIYKTIFEWSKHNFPFGFPELS